MKKETGAITVFVIISIMFFLIVLTGIVTNVQAKLSAQAEQINKIKQNYEIDIDEAYYEKIKNLTRD